MRTNAWMETCCAMGYPDLCSYRRAQNDRCCACASDCRFRDHLQYYASRLNQKMPRSRCTHSRYVCPRHLARHWLHVRC